MAPNVLPALMASALFADAENVAFDDRYGDVRIFLRECDEPREECVQGFGSEVYRCVSDPRECLLLMLDWSQNAIGYELDPGPEGLSVALA